VISAEGLVSGGDGQCDAWARLLQRVLSAQSEAFVGKAPRVLIKPLQNPAETASALEFLVKKYSTAGPGQSGSGAFPYRYNHACPAPPDWAWPDGGEVIDAIGMPGQNSADPASSFAVHVVVLYEGEYYDPSYGLGPYPGNVTGARDWENSSVFGFAGQVPGPRLGVRLNNPQVAELVFTTIDVVQP
jgi:hypothetical protein